MNSHLSANNQRKLFYFIIITAIIFLIYTQSDTQNDTQEHQIKSAEEEDPFETSIEAKDIKEDTKQEVTLSIPFEFTSKWRVTYKKPQETKKKQIFKEMTQSADLKCVDSRVPCLSFGTEVFLDSKNKQEGIDYIINFWKRYEQEDCGYPCQFVSDLSQADAVIFSSEEIRKEFSWKRHFNQVYIYLNFQSPLETKLNANNVVKDSKFRFFFNKTAGYHKDSEIYIPFGEYLNAKKFNSLPNNSTVNYLTGKTKFAFTEITDCDYLSITLRKIKDLQMHFPIDIYGPCVGEDVRKYSMSFVELSKKYKFYISIESAFCSHFITEKYFSDVLHSFAIPVVFGGLYVEDYEAVSPNNSFIYALNFATARDLAVSLKEIGDREFLYNSYFAWKAQGGYFHKPGVICSICKHLHTKPRQRQMSDLKRFVDAEKLCRPGKTKYLP